MDELIPGQFRQFKAATKFHLGKLSIDVPEGETVEFDGQTLRMKGTEYTIPELRAGVKVGWIVPVEVMPAAYKAKPADVRVRSAQDKKGAKTSLATVQDDERDVGPAVRKNAKDTAEKKETFSREIRVQDDVERDVGSAVGRITGVEKTAATPVSSGGVESQNPRTIGKIGSSMRVVSDTTEAQDAKPIGRIATPAVQKTVISDAAAAARAAKNLDDGPPRRAAAAVIPAKGARDLHAAEAEKVEDIIDALEPEGRAKMMAEQRKQKLAGSKASAPVAKAVATPAPAAKPKVAAKPRARSAPTTVEEVIVRGDEIDLPVGIKWDLTIHWRSRAKIASEKYGSNAEVLAAIRAVESPAVNALINERLVALAKA